MYFFFLSKFRYKNRILQKKNILILKITRKGKKIKLNHKINEVEF